MFDLVRRQNLSGAVVFIGSPQVFKDAYPARNFYRYTREDPSAHGNLEPLASVSSP